ncbi:unnamed protein product [Spirodela intermedia]|uniref:Uncharacterized protein n=1 Tax=Spirodela intermedia TaxID=51605 RepID=A0A7I8JN82_SPIIN|nr:unnamed protein product [Spirodela intermedia]CAA6671043.1 unnamed protein product [Spirodela intermedia]
MALSLCSMEDPSVVSIQLSCVPVETSEFPMVLSNFINSLTTSNYLP